MTALCAARRSLRRCRALFVPVFLLFFWGSAAFAQQSAAVASAHPLATAAGREILDAGGNAFDAAIAVAAALAVVEPYSSGLGGGGFFLLYRAADSRYTMVDARETAPAGVTAGHYFHPDGRPISGATVRGGTAAAIPGLPAALVHVAARYGSLPLEVTLAPAMKLAREGFAIDARYARIAKIRESFLQSGVNTQLFLQDGSAPQPGFVLRQPDLANTLGRLARDGSAGFYEGAVARAMVDTVNRSGGVWTASDLANYRVTERPPVQFRFRGALVTAASLPSAGGVALAQTLGMLEGSAKISIGNPATDHLVVEALRRAFQDRARYLADPEFFPVPLQKLLSRNYLRERAATINPLRATPSETFSDPVTAAAESGNTTHLSVVDSSGNRVAATLTINLLFGSGIVAEGTGVLLNNEMDDFTVRPDVPNAFQLRGGIANRIEPGKRPLSSMTPVFVEDDKGVLALGAPGGSRIISQVLLAILEYVRNRDVDLERLVGMPRYHHQFWPDRVEVEPDAFSSEWMADMAKRGHAIHRANRPWGNMQAVFKARRGGHAQAASDPRGKDVAWY